MVITHLLASASAERRSGLAASPLRPLCCRLNPTLILTFAWVSPAVVPEGDISGMFMTPESECRGRGLFHLTYLEVGGALTNVDGTDVPCKFN